LIREAFYSNSEIPDFMEQTFIRQLFLGTENAQSPILAIEEIFAKYPELVQSEEHRSAGDRNIYSFAAIKYLTNVKNHLVLNFPKILKRYLYDYTPLTRDEAVDALYKINNWTRRGSKNQIATSTATEQVVQKVRSLLGLKDKDQTTDRWFKDTDNLKKVLKFFAFVSQIIESKDEKLFNLLPISKIKSHFITIDTSVIKGVLKDAGLLKCNGGGGMERELWDSVIKSSLVSGKNKTFTGTIDTDGLVANIHFTRPKNVIEKGDEEIISLEGKRVIGVDPGRTNIFFMTEELPTGRFKSYSLSRKQYYAESGIFAARTQSEKWNNQVKTELEALSKTSSKSTCIHKFREYVETVLSVQEALWDQYLKRHWKEQRLRLYGGKKRVFANFINRLNPDANTVLAYGSAKFASGGRGEMSVPTSRAFKECKSRIPIVLVDEFRTSKVHWKDDKILKTVVKRKEDGKLAVVRGLLWCGSTNEINKFVNRDLNAAINILRCATLPSRPTMLDRRRATGKIVQTRGAILKC
jgi:transposase